MPTRAHVHQRCKRRHEQIKFLLENMTDPQFVPNDSFNTLTGTFNMVDDKTSGWNPVGITYTIMNHADPRFLRVDPENPKSYSSLATLMNKIEPYLPYKLRSDKRCNKLWRGDSMIFDKMDPETVDLMKELHYWFLEMRNKIETELTSRYFMGGKAQHIEILKRRFKEGWTEKIETENNTKAEVTGGFNINISFEDIPDEQDVEDKTT